MSAEGDLFEYGWGDASAGRIVILEMNCGHFQSGLGSGAANESQKDVQRRENIARPGRRDLTEEPMLDGIPFRGARRIVADGDLATGLIGEFLQAFLEHPRSRTVAATAIRFNH